MIYIVKFLWIFLFEYRILSKFIK